MATPQRAVSGVRRRLIATSATACRFRYPASQLRRSYFSIHHPDRPPFPEAQDKILAAAIGRVPKHGFTEQSLVLGAKDAGYLDVTVQLFPRGVFDLVHYHLVTQRLALKHNVQFPEGTPLGLGSKIRTLAMARLRANADIIHQWQGALGHISLLGNIPASLKELNALSDEIWYLAGDTAVDFSWYTKRASLAAVYASSEMFMTTDKTHDFAATEEFLDRRLKDAQNVGSTAGGFSQYVGFWAGNTVNIARSWGMKV
ncbi:Ubiquinone biosynthesis protein coq9, mitochondrial [Exophiala xenobiotica]|nr:Ubiquinone biosynthesis protein coq9, mitochondrial [Exophiala xenobiotica]KAK5377725.1 Ubiquinone biosynthesis protein coq9, mitochondrial [Exophiala xenobiotica]KAK5400468.1 Ubiquinone biosynthesis protein coq9, mitochondrial [Exophiala xenobiotica]KAK5420773.1 Ubiquinone biosynthesis protein coq9, mitochondrial [Exophiala xenobiotica]KAK5469676.1 Ubiquinone biosynthesis protein coq9, mitochondrial [Exophiala xenobiotica]